FCATVVMVPRVGDRGGTVPVVASGGIADGRGIAAALTLGAQGVNLGTRFLATAEMRVSDRWKQAIVEADPLDAVKVDFADAALPPLSPGGVPAVPRALRTEFIDRWNADPSGARSAPDRSAALVHDVVPAAALISRTVAEAEEALQAASVWVRAG